MSFSTPEYKIDDESVYSPSEDTFLLLDALQKEKELIVGIRPSLSVEIGSGSGVVTVFLHQILAGSCATTSATTLHSICTDLNEKALRCTKRTAQMNSLGTHSLHLVHCNILDPLFPRLANSVDVLLLNPPYVPTEETEAQNEQALCYAGGQHGRNLLDKLLPRIADLLSPKGIFYLVALKQNGVDELLSRETRKRFRLDATIVLQRKCRNEDLYVLKFTKEVEGENSQKSPKSSSISQKTVAAAPANKIFVHVKPVGAAPQLRKDHTNLKMDPTWTIVRLQQQLRKWLGIKPTDSFYIFVNEAFAPGLEQTIGNLHRCFGSGNTLYVQYSITPAWG